MSENSAPAKVGAKQKINGFVHKLFGSTPGDGEMQPKEGISYSLCGFGQNLICTIIGSYLTVFMTDAIGFNALAVAILMLAARVYDALNDPIMGSIVDRTRTKWGKCRPYMKWMAFPIAAMTAICFLPWYPNNDGGFAALSVMYIIWGMVYTVADVPYWGLSTAMSNDTYRRGNLLTIARLFCTAGAGIITVFTPIITQAITATDNATVTAIQTLMNTMNGSEVVAGNTAFFDMFRGIENVGAFIQSQADKYQDVLALFQGANIDINQSGAALLELKATASASMMGDLRWTYFIIAIVCCAIAIPLFFLGFKNTKERNVTTENPPSLAHNLKEQTAHAHRFVGYRRCGKNVVHVHRRSLLCKIHNEQRVDVRSLHDGNRAGRTYRVLARALVHQEVRQKEHVHLVSHHRWRGNARGVYRWYCGGPRQLHQHRNDGCSSHRTRYSGYPVGLRQHHHLCDDRRHCRISRTQDR